MKKDMQSEFGKLMKAVIVSSSSDINQGVLQKLFKGPLVNFLSSEFNGQQYEPMQVCS